MPFVPICRLIPSEQIKREKSLFFALSAHINFRLQTLYISVVESLRHFINAAVMKTVLEEKRAYGEMKNFLAWLYGIVMCMGIIRKC